MNFTIENDSTMTKIVSAPSNRQDLIYSRAIDQSKNNLGKDGWSMNLDELLQIYDEKTQDEGLHRRNSINMHHQVFNENTVDEIFKHTIEEKQHSVGDGGEINIQNILRQQTLRENTIEDLLIRAGVGRYNNNDICSRDLVFVNPSESLDVGIQWKTMQNICNSSLHRNVNGCMSSYQPQQQDQLQPQQFIMSSKAHGYGNGYVCGKQILFPSGQVNAHEIRGDFTKNGNRTLHENNINLVPTIAAYPILDGIKKNNGNSSSISPSPYLFNSSQIIRGQKKYKGIVMKKKYSEITKRRKIKNRESAARSRARKEARVTELEDENEKLRKENQELKEKQLKELINLQGRPERKLRRTQSDIK